jgi:hypothetical protein
MRKRNISTRVGRPGIGGNSSAAADIAVAAPIFTVHIAIPGLTQWIPPYDFAFTWAQPMAVFWLVVMTGVTTLARATAYQMELTGITLPVRDIFPKV